MYSRACQRVPQIHTVPYLGIAGDGSDFRIDEMRHQPRDRVTGDYGVGIDADEEFGISNMFDAIVKSVGLPEFAW